MNEELPKTLQDLLYVLEEYLREHGYPPSVRDLSKAMNFSSTSSVVYRLRQLEKRGLIRRDRHIARGITVRAPDVGNLA